MTSQMEEVLSALIGLTVGFVRKGRFSGAVMQTPALVLYITSQLNQDQLQTWSSVWLLMKRRNL